MNCHVEHHMFPMMPYHVSPKLHGMIKHDLPAPNPSILHGYREMIPAFTRQLRNEDCFVRCDLPPAARPYREEFHSARGRRQMHRLPSARGIDFVGEFLSEP